MIKINFFQRNPKIIYFLASLNDDTAKNRCAVAGLAAIAPVQRNVVPIRTDQNVFLIVGSGFKLQ